ncbi:MAG: hypothetical protein GY792_17410 [Gammaproteobacteria bacterium]|nr:hypothetical protein [Gammaproteobacteria bacterium]
MKFNQLKIGQRFHYRSADYTKTGPLQAVAEGSANAQLIMRSASVKPLTAETETQPPAGSVTGLLHQALDTYHSECKALLQTADVDTAALDRLEIRYQELLQILDKE